MNKTSLAAAALAVTATSLVAALVANGTVGASSAAPQANGNKHITLTFIDRVDANSNTDLDIGDPGLSPGDGQVFTDRLMRKGKRVGTASGVATLTAVSDSGITGSFAATALLRRGTLTVQGGFVEVFAEGPDKVRFSAITGGTGAYAGATGECRSKTLGDGDDSRMTCKVVLP